MDTGRLLSAMYVIWSDFNDYELQEKFVALNTATQNLAALPTDVTSSTAFSEAVKTLRDSLKVVKSNTAGRSTLDALRDSGLAFLIGTNLLSRLNRILNASPFLIPQAAQQVTVLTKEVRAEWQKLQTAVSAFESLNIETQDADEDVYEIGILMPSTLTRDDLKIVTKEFEEWVFAIERIEELVTGEVPSAIPIRNVASGSLDLYCGFHATGAQAMVLLTMGAYTIIQFVRDAQKRRKEMQDLHYPDEVISPLIRHEEKLVDNGKDEIVKKLLEKRSSNLPKYRDNEITTALRHIVSFVLRRVNEGVDVEVSLPPVAEGEREIANEEVKAMREEIERLRIEMNQITRALPDRATPILELPPPDPKDSIASTKTPSPDFSEAESKKVDTSRPVVEKPKRRKRTSRKANPNDLQGGDHS